MSHGTFGGGTTSAATLVKKHDVARLRRVIESGAWKRMVENKTRALCDALLVTGNEDTARRWVMCIVLYS